MSGSDDPWFPRPYRSPWNAIEEFLPRSQEKQRFIHMWTHLHDPTSAEEDEREVLYQCMHAELLHLLCAGSLEAEARLAGAFERRPIPRQWWVGASIDLFEGDATNHGVRATGIGIRRAIPAPAEPEVPPVAPAPSAPLPPRGRGGRPETYDWSLFDQEVVRRLALDGDTYTRSAFRRMMREWAGANMPDPSPSESAVDRHFSKLPWLPPDVFAPD